jgi:glyoxylate reductase
MGRIVVTRATPGRAVDLLRGAGHVVDVWPGATPPPPADLAAMLAGADGALTMVTDRVTPAMLAANPGLRIVANMAVGYDNIDPAAAGEAGVWVTNTPGILAETTADLAFGLLMAAARQIVLSDRDTRAGGWKAWSPTAFLGADVHGATLGIIGLGEIGTAVARRATGFRMRTLYTARTPKPEAERETGAVRADLDALLHESDFVSLHVPLTAETRHMLGDREFALMKRTAILVNTARGTVIDQDALVRALQAGRIAGAALDVTDPEPLPLDHALYTFPNVVITPHIASASLATRSRMAELAARNIIAVLAGSDPLTPVNRPAVPRR